MIGIINYGSGNIRAIGNIFDKIKIPYIVANSPSDLSSVDRLILPGVGAFDSTMETLNKSGFRDILDKLVILGHMPILGICVGMQILSKSSEEGKLPGLGWIDAKVLKFNNDLFTSKPKLPHMGWNSVEIIHKHGLFKNIDPLEGFYFIHSYYICCNNNDDVATRTFYGFNFASSVIRNNIFGVQFHPEKSHENGVELLKNFALL